MGDWTNAPSVTLLSALGGGDEVVSSIPSSDGRETRVLRLGVCVKTVFSASTDDEGSPVLVNSSMDSSPADQLSSLLSAATAASSSDFFWE